MKKIIAAALSTLAVVVLCAVWVQPAYAANTWIVDPGGGGNFTTIGTAVANPGVVNGDTIIVSAGTYAENVTINKQLTLKGANAGVKGDTARGAETVWNGKPVIGAANVTLDGFTFGATATIGSAFDGMNIINNIFDSTTASNIFALNPSGTMQGFTFSRNWVKNTTTSGTIVYAGGKKVNSFTFSDNKVDNRSVYTSGQGYSVFLDGPTAGFPLFTNVVITGNTVTGGAKRAFNITSMSDYVIKDNVVEGKYYAFMIGGKNGEISGNTITSLQADPTNESDVYAVGYGFMFSLSVFDATVQLSDVSFHDNTIYYAAYNENDWNSYRNYAVIFSISKAGTVSNVNTIYPLVSNLQLYDNNFVNMASPTATYFPIQWTVQNSFAAEQKLLDARSNNYYWGTAGSSPSTWERMNWYVVFNKLKNCQYDWEITFDANGGEFDKTDNPDWHYDINTPTKIDNPRDAWRFDPDPAKQLGYARALNDGDRETSGVLPFATSAGGPLAGSIAPSEIRVPTKAGFAFLGWYTDINLTQKWDPSTYYTTADSTIYAKWGSPHSVSYEGNGASAGSSPVDPGNPHFEGDPVSVLDRGSLTRDGYTFVGWNTKADGSGSQYAAGSQFSMPDQDVVLYAQWRANSPTPPTPPTPLPTPDPTPTPTPTPGPPVTPEQVNQTVEVAKASAVILSTKIMLSVSGALSHPIDDPKTPLSGKDGKECLVHPIMIVLTVLTLIYGVGAIIHRRRFTRYLDDFDERLILR